MQLFTVFYLFSKIYLISLLLLMFRVLPSVISVTGHCNALQERIFSVNYVTIRPESLTAPI